MKGQHFYRWHVRPQCSAKYDNSVLKGIRICRLLSFGLASPSKEFFTPIQGHSIVVNKYIICNIDVL